MSPKPIVTRETSQYAHRSSCDCVDCQDARRIARNPHLYGYEERPGANIPIRAYVIGLALSAVIILVGFAILWSVPGYAREGGSKVSSPNLWLRDAKPRIVRPIKAPDALLRARADCPGTTTVVECRGHLREAYQALEWTRKTRLNHHTVSPSNLTPLEVGRELAIRRGWGGRQFTCVAVLWNRESGWIPTKSNYAGSGAYGIPQALPGSKMASAGADWQTNPATQIRWGYGYIAARYGTPCAALHHSDEHGYY